MGRTIPALVIVAGVSLAVTTAAPTPARPGVAAAQEVRRTGVERPAVERRHSFHFTRAIYSSGWGSRGRRAAWATDYPKADEQFMVVVRRVTNLDAHPGANPVALDDPGLRRYPFLYAVEVGYMNLTEQEVEGLRGYLLAGGFLMVDDFWGTREWDAFEANIRRVFPDRPIEEIPLDHEIFRSYYRIEALKQVPAVNNIRWGRTWERDGYVPHVRGIYADDGRLMVVINWNTDLGDAWEWADIPEYPLEYSTFAYQMGVNTIVYAMSH